MQAIRNRWLARPLQAALKALPVVVLTGARQTGKTRLAQSLPQKRTFVSLDDLGILGQAHSDPDSLLASRPVTLDEVQRAPELLLPVKRQVDRWHKLFGHLFSGRSFRTGAKGAAGGCGVAGLLPHGLPVFASQPCTSARPELSLSKILR